MQLHDAMVVPALTSSFGLLEVAALRTTCEDLRCASQPVAVAALLDAVAHESCPKQRMRAMRALPGVVGGKDRTAAELALESLGDHRLCMAAARALPRLVAHHDSMVISVGCEKLLSDSAQVRQAAVSVLAELAERGDDAVVTVLSKVAHSDTDWCVRASAVRALPRLAHRGDDKVYNVLKVCLNDCHPRVRHVSAGAIVHVAPVPSMPFLSRTQTPSRRKPNRRQSEEPPTPSPWKRACQVSKISAFGMSDTQITKARN